MLNTIKQFFFDYIQLPYTGDKQTIQQAVNTAAAVLLIEVAKADFNLSGSEQTRIAMLLQEKLQLPDTATNELITLAQHESLKSTSLHQFTRLIHEHYPIEQKRQLMQQLWHVALTDKQIDRYEDYILRKIADLIYLSHQEFIQAKLQAMDAENR